MPAARTPAIPDRASQDEHVERLYAEFADRLLAYCVTHVGCRAEAEDALQLTFLCALRALRRGVVPRSESAWLHAIARNVCRSQLRSAARRPKLDATSLDSLASSDVENDGELLATCGPRSKRFRRGSGARSSCTSGTGSRLPRSRDGCGSRLPRPRRC